MHFDDALHAARDGLGVVGIVQVRHRSPEPHHPLQDRHLDLAALEEAAASVVLLAAATLRERFAAGVAPEQVEFKDKHQRDPVTAIDRAVEALVRAELHARFPTHGILGEEGTGDAVESSLVWVLDPIDGTGISANRPGARSRLRSPLSR